LDRLTRSVLHFATLLEWFDLAGATLVALDLAVDTSTRGGRLTPTFSHQSPSGSAESSLLGAATVSRRSGRKGRLLAGLRLSTNQILPGG